MIIFPDLSIKPPACCDAAEARAWLADLREMAALGDPDAIRLLPSVLTHLEVAR